jgi:hypothetical protein
MIRKTEELEEKEQLIMLRDEHKEGRLPPMPITKLSSKSAVSKQEIQYLILFL